MTSISALPSALHCLAILLAAVSCMVAVCTATFLPHRSDVSTLFGLPFFTAHAEPALKWLTKSTASRRSLVTVNDEMPMSYLAPTAGIIESKFAVSGSASRPNTPASALAMSTSKPTGVLPSAARNSAVVAGAACRAGGEHGHAQHERGGGFQGFSCLHVPSPMDSYRPVQPNRILA